MSRARADVLVEDVESVDAFFVVDGVADLEGVEAEFEGPVEVVGCYIEVNLIATGASEQAIDGLVEELALEVPEGEVDAGLGDGGDAACAESLGGAPHEVVEVLGGEAVAAFEEGAEVVVDEGCGELAEAALSEAVCAVFGDDLHPEVCLGVCAGHLAVHAGELGVLVDGEGTARVGVPAVATGGGLGGCAGDVDVDGADGLDFHFFSPG